MSTESNILLMALGACSDPDQAAWLVDRIGGQAIGVVPGVAFPGAWVQARQKGPHELAAYTVAHCDDQATLDAIARVARRASVRLALANNPALSDKARMSLRERALEHKDKALLKALDRFDRYGSITDDMLLDLELLEEIERSGGPGAFDAMEIDDLLLGLYGATSSCAIGRPLAIEALAAGAAWLAGDLLAEDYIRLEDWETSHQLATGLSSAQAFVLLDSRFHPGAYESFLERIVYSRGGVERRVGAELMTELMDVCSKVPGHLECDDEWLDAGAIKAVIDIPAWHPVLAGHALSPDQFDRLVACSQGVLLDVLERACVAHDLGREETTRRMRAVVATWPKHPLAIRQEYLDLCQDTQDPLFSFLLEHADSSNLVGYLTGGWYIMSNRVVADCDLVPEIVKRLGALSPWDLRDLSASMQDPEMPWDLVVLLLEHVPGLARASVGFAARRVRDYVFGRLMSSGAPLEDALLAFSSNETASLARICSALEALTRLGEA